MISKDYKVVEKPARILVGLLENELKDVVKYNEFLEEHHEFVDKSPENEKLWMCIETAFNEAGLDSPQSYEEFKLKSYDMDHRKFGQRNGEVLNMNLAIKSAQKTIDDREREMSKVVSERSDFGAIVEEAKERLREERASVAISYSVLKSLDNEGFRDVFNKKERKELANTCNYMFDESANEVQLIEDIANWEMSNEKIETMSIAILCDQTSLDGIDEVNVEEFFHRASQDEVLDLIRASFNQKTGEPLEDAIKNVVDKMCSMEENIDEIVDGIENEDQRVVIVDAVYDHGLGKKSKGR